jgi:hypothetical protein
MLWLQRTIPPAMARTAVILNGVRAGAQIEHWGRPGFSGDMTAAAPPG